MSVRFGGKCSSAARRMIDNPGKCNMMSKPGNKQNNPFDLYRNIAIIIQDRIPDPETVMPRFEVVMFADERGDAPLLEWLDRVPNKVRDKFIVRIERLSGSI